ncbi:hypothetical protein A2U01_0074035, partial [Trifolium medium]|nr:hypothetical protein [Trifolium medium]
MTLGSSLCTGDMLVIVFVIRGEVLAYEVPVTRRGSRFARKELVIFPIRRHSLELRGGLRELRATITRRNCHCVRGDVLVKSFT